MQTKLQELANRVRSATSALDRAERAMVQEKNSRGFIATVVDAMSVTDAEAAVQAAEAEVRRCKKDAAAAVRGWVPERALALLSESKGIVGKREDQLRVLDLAKGGLEQAQRWHESARRTQESLIEAADACGSASTAEAFDMVTKSTLVSLVSACQTSGAKDAVSEAQEQQAAFAVLYKTEIAQALQAQPASSTSVGALDVSVVLDSLFDFDLISFFSMRKLDTVKARCEREASKLTPVVERLHDMVQQAKARFDAEVLVLQELEAPFLRQAAAEVPEVIRQKVPRRI